MFDWGNVLQGNLRWGKGGQGYLRRGLMLDNRPSSRRGGGGGGGDSSNGSNSSNDDQSPD